MTNEKLKNKSRDCFIHQLKSVNTHYLFIIFQTNKGISTPKNFFLLLLIKINLRKYYIEEKQQLI